MTCTCCLRHHQLHWPHHITWLPAPHLLQMTVFVALLAYDTIRMEQYRVDCAPCVQLPPRGGRLLLLAEAVAPGGVSDVLADAVGNPAQVEGVLRHRSLQHVLQVGDGGSWGQLLW